MSAVVAVEFVAHVGAAAELGCHLGQAHAWTLLVAAFVDDGHVTTERLQSDVASPESFGIGTCFAIASFEAQSCCFEIWVVCGFVPVALQADDYCHGFLQTLLEPFAAGLEGQVANIVAAVELQSVRSSTTVLLLKLNGKATPSLLPYQFCFYGGIHFFGDYATLHEYVVYASEQDHGVLSKVSCNVSCPAAFAEDWWMHCP